ncbi:MAG TPA: S-layer homology domain-containing protein [Bacillota bacterium]
MRPPSLLQRRRGRLRPPRRRFLAVLAASLAGALLWLPAAAAAAGFRDVGGHWAEPAILRLQARSGISGYPDGTFRPDRAMLRFEAAAVLGRGMDLAPRGGSLPYADAGRIPAWSAPHVAAVAPLMRGVPDARGNLHFRGEQVLTRAELAVILDRAHRLLTGAEPNPAAGRPDYADAAAIPPWARAAVAAVQAAGIMNGRPNRRFAPAAAVTRAEFAAALIRLLDRYAAGEDGDDGGQGDGGLRDPRAGGPYVLAYYLNSGASRRGMLRTLQQARGTVTMAAEVGFAVDWNGRVLGEPDQELRTHARDAGLPVVAVVQNDLGFGFDRSLVHHVLTSPGVAERAVAAIVDLAARNGYAGINLDFENVPPRDRDALTAFARDLAAALHDRGLLFIIAVPPQVSDNPADPWSGAFDYRMLGGIADYVVVMAYDQHWAGGEPGPVAGLPWTRDVAAHAAAEIPLSRLLLGVAAYGYVWPVGGTGRAMTARQAPALAAEHGAVIRWHDGEQVPYFRYRQGGVEHIAYFENAHSLRFKLDLARSLGAAGVALWRLGYTDADTWPLLAAYRQGGHLTVNGN